MFSAHCHRWLPVSCRSISHTSWLTAKMQAWQSHQYGTPKDLILNTCAPVPAIKSPTDILVRVHASSINPIDVMMLGGYGSKLIGMWKMVSDCPEATSNFPLTFGRDFSGIVTDIGQEAKHFKQGDEVWGAVNPRQQGAHAEYILVDMSNVAKKPVSCSHTEAASLPFAALTAWAALNVFGGLNKNNVKGMRALILGGSGGVGTFAIQLLRAWQASVTATCSTDAVEMVKNLGADTVVDYKTQDVERELTAIRGFDVILDCVKGTSHSFALSLLKPWALARYISLNPPVLKNTDHYGVTAGSMVSGFRATWETFMGLKDGKGVRWAFFLPLGCALETISAMIDHGQITTVINNVYNFQDVPAAYEKMLEGHARGKMVIEHIH